MTRKNIQSATRTWRKKAGSDLCLKTSICEWWRWSWGPPLPRAGPSATAGVFWGSRCVGASWSAHAESGWAWPWSSSCRARSGSSRHRPPPRFRAAAGAVGGDGERGREGKRGRNDCRWQHRWAGTTDSLLLKRLINEQINSQSRPCCLTPRPFPLQDNCLDCALCLRECLNQQANGAVEAWKAHKSHGGQGWVESRQTPFRSPRPRRRMGALIPFTHQKPPVSEKETPNICLFHAWDAKYWSHCVISSLSHRDRGAKPSRGRKGDINPVSQKLERSTIGGQHSQRRKSAKVLLTCQPEKCSPGPARRSLPSPRLMAGARWAEGPVVTPYLHKLLSQHRAAL